MALPAAAGACLNDVGWLGDFLWAPAVPAGGELLDAVLEKGHYSEADARSCFLQIIRAIQYLHSRCGGSGCSWSCLWRVLPNGRCAVAAWRNCWTLGSALVVGSLA